VNVRIRPDVEARLAARAHCSGESLEGYIQRLLEREASASADRNPSHSMTGAQKAEAFRAWAKSFPANLPRLSLDDISREKIYERD